MCLMQGWERTFQSSDITGAHDVAMFALCLLLDVASMLLMHVQDASLMSSIAVLLKHFLNHP